MQGQCVVVMRNMAGADARFGVAVQALDRPIPDIPFPRLNDAKDFEDHFKKLAVRGLARWALFGVTLSAATLGALLIGVKMLETPPTFMERKSGLLSAVGGGLLALGALLTRYI